MGSTSNELVFHRDKSDLSRRGGGSTVEQSSVVDGLQPIITTAVKKEK